MEDDFWSSHCETAISSYIHMCSRRTCLVSLFIRRRDPVDTYPANTWNISNASPPSHEPDTHRLPRTRPDITGCPERRCGLTSTQLTRGRTYREEMMSVFVMRLKVHDGSRMSIRPRGRIHLSYRVIARPGEPHVEIAGTGLSMDFADLDLLLGFRCAAIVMTGLDDIEREPVDIWKLGR